MTDHDDVTVFVPVRLPAAGCISVDVRDGARVLRLVGEIDAETVAAYRREHPDETGTVSAVDLTGVCFLSSSAVSFLIRQTQPLRERGQLPVLSGVSGRALRVLELTGASALFAPTR